MATYAELFALTATPEGDDLRKKIAVAAVVKAHSLLSSDTPAQPTIDWARDTLANPVERARSLMHYVLAANKDATTTQIGSAADTAIQTNVDAAVDAILGL